MSTPFSVVSVSVSVSVSVGGGGGVCGRSQRGGARRDTTTTTTRMRLATASSSSSSSHLSRRKVKGGSKRTDAFTCSVFNSNNNNNENNSNGNNNDRAEKRSATNAAAPFTFTNNKTADGRKNTLDSSLSKATMVSEFQLKEMSKLQAKCFFTPILGPSSPLDQLSMFLFQGDVDDTLIEKFEYVKQDRFAPLAVMRKSEMGNLQNAKKTKDGAQPAVSDTGIVGVAEVSVQRDVLIGRSIMKFKNLEEANSEYAYVSCMCVDEEYRKMGVATELLRESEIVAKKWGFDLLCLHCYEDNIPGISLYKQLGYEELLTDMSFKSPLDIILRKRKVLMCKDI